MRKRGSIHLGRRLEAGFALLAFMYNRAHGGKAEMMDFQPHEEEPVATISDIVKALGAVPAGGGKRGIEKPGDTDS